MKIIGKYLLGNIPRSPDEGGGDPTPEPSVLAADPAPAPVAADPAAEVGDRAPEPAPAPAPQPSAPPKWALERIGEETTKRQAAEERERVATERANNLEEITRRLQAQSKPDGAPAPVPAPQPAAQGLDQTAIQQEAAKIVFREKAATVINAGATQFGAKWQEAVAVLDSLGAATADFVSGVMEVDHAKAHEILFDLAQNPERAVAMVRMSPTKRIAELTRMVMAKETAPADTKPAVVDTKPAISRAPTPRPSLTPHAAAPEIDPRTPEGNEKMTDAEFNAWYVKTYMKRTG